METAIVFPALLAVLALMLMCGRAATANLAVQDAAYAAARAASLERSAGQARAAATSAAASSLASARMGCATQSVQVDTSGFAARVGETSNVRVEVACTASFADLDLPGAPASHTWRAAALSPIDAFRMRS